MAEQFDVVVIGSGPGGYYAAIRCAQKNKKVAIVEKDLIGGTCLNSGCIPSRSLLGSAHFMTMERHARAMGVDMGKATPNWPRIIARKNTVIKGLRTGLSRLIEENRIKIFNGLGQVISKGTVKITGDRGESELRADNIIIATGSEATGIPSIPYDGNFVISNKEIFDLDDIPESMIIIGGGVIGCEVACLYAAMGTKVTILTLPGRHVLSRQDEWIRQIMLKEFKRQGIKCIEGEGIESIDRSSSAMGVLIGSGERIQASKIFVSIGRSPVYDRDTVETLNLEMNRGLLKVNRKMQTSSLGVYAVGDVIGTTYLAHGAFAEAEIAAENIAGNNLEMGDYNLIPHAIYTFPEVGSIGKTEKQCEDEGLDYSVGKSMFRSNGASLAYNNMLGEIRTIRDNSTDRIVGISMVGNAVTELLAAARALIGTSEKISDISFAHPTASEVLKEAWEDAFGISLHNMPK